MAHTHKATRQNDRRFAGAVKRAVVVQFGLLALLFQATVYSETRAATADVDTGSTAGEAELTVEGILQRDPKDSDYSKSETCIDTRRIRTSKVLDDRHLVFVLSGRKHYLLQLKRRCIGLRPNQMIRYEIRGGRLCRGDTFQGMDRFAGNMEVPSARCVVPGFETIAEEQYETLKVMIKDERDRSRAARKAEREARRKAQEERRKAKKRSE